MLAFSFFCSYMFANRAGGLRGPVAVLEQKERLNLRNVVDKSRERRQGRRGYATREPSVVSRKFAGLQ
jgi:hypothetical protein